MDELVAAFVAAEDRNFALFNHVNEHAQETERVDEHINQLRNQILEIEGQGLSSDCLRARVLVLWHPARSYRAGAVRLRRLRLLGL